MRTHPRNQATAQRYYALFQAMNTLTTASDEWHVVLVSKLRRVLERRYGIIV